MDGNDLSIDLSTFHTIDKHAIYLIDEIKHRTERKTADLKNEPHIDTGLSLLKSFIPIDKNSFKRDNLRTKLIRGHKKVLRIVIRHCKKYKYMLWKKFIPKKRFFRSRKDSQNANKSNLHAFDIDSRSEIDKWDAIAKVYSENTHFFQSISKTNNGMKLQSRHKDLDTPWKSFNTEFCKAYFSNGLTRRSFVAFLDLVFNNRTPDDYIQRFNMKCCRNTQHDHDCHIKWKNLKLLLSRQAFWLID